MFFHVDKKIANIGDGVYTGVVVAYGLDNNTVCLRSAELLKNEVKNVYESLKERDVKSIDALNVYRNAMEEMGINSSKFPCSIEAILTRIFKKGEFPSMTPVIDLSNYISIKYKVPVGVHDIDSLSGDLCVRLATLNDCESTENKDERDKLVEGEPVYVSGTSVRTRRWLWRQTQSGRINEKSTNFIFLIDGFNSNKEDIDAACNELVALLKSIFNVDSEVGKVSSEETEFRFGIMTEEEEYIENQIAIMLKGVAQHTAVSQIREKLNNARKQNRPLRVKLGLDPSAPDIHIGHSVVLRKIRQLQDMGHIAIIIIGDYTGMIGDPTGKSKTRRQLSREDVEKNANTYMEQIFKIIDRNMTEVYYNSDWLSKMTFGDVIELASKCTVARMLERDDFNNRYTRHLPLSIHEFFYPLMQAYDSVAVRADIELGGTDQTFNILLGRNIQKDYGQDPQLTLFMPLLEGIDGVEKMSKSLGNYIGISEPAEIIFEKVMKIPDVLIIKYFNLCTDVHPNEIIRFQSMLENGTNPRDVKMLLAHEITELYAGQDAANYAMEHFKDVYQLNKMPKDAPVLEIFSSEGICDGEQIVATLVQGGYYKSKGEVRRVFAQGGAQLDGEKVKDVKTIKIKEGTAELKMGKARFFKIIRQ